MEFRPTPSGIDRGTRPVLVGMMVGEGLLARDGVWNGRRILPEGWAAFMGQGVTVVPETETIVVRHGFGPWFQGDLLERIFHGSSYPLGTEADQAAAAFSHT